MHRRQFIRYSAFVSGALLSLPSYAASASTYDLVTVQGGSPAEMLQKGLDALGGLNRFIQKGQKVLIKPDIGWDRIPEQGANTDPELIESLVELCYKSGAREVHAVDHTHDSWTKCYKNSGIERAVKTANGKIFPGNMEFLYQQVSIPGAKKLAQVEVHNELFNTDVIINVPVLKNDSETIISGSIKNMLGLVWDWDKINQLGVDTCMIDLLRFRKPVLNILDAHRVITQNGPTGKSANDVRLLKSMIISNDIVAADSAAARLLGILPETISHLVLAQNEGIGKISLNQDKICNIQL